MSTPQGLAILGSTGSVGRSTLAVVALHPERFRVAVLGAHGSWQAIDGYSGSPDLADAQLGHTFFDVATRRMAHSFVEFWRSTETLGRT